jgi:hypothetical protein
MSELGRQMSEDYSGIQHWTLAMEKQVGARVATVMGDPMLLSVFQAFGAEVFRRSSVFHGLGKFLADNDVRGKCCFEIGTWNGLTAALLSRHFEHVVTVDIAPQAIKRDILSHLGIKNVECIDITSNEKKPGVLKDIAKAGRTIDCAYLDGNHHEDTESDWLLTKHVGRAIFHECWRFQSPVWSLVQSLPREEVVYGGCGLAMWTGKNG